MKKFISLVMVFAVLLALPSCGMGPDEPLENGEAYFNAAVLEVKEGYIEVECTETFNSGIPAGEKFSVSTKVVSASGAPEIAVGDNIRVVFDGNVMERDPLQIGKVFAIYLLDKSGEIISDDVQKPYAGAPFIMINGKEYFADISSILNELPEGYEYGGELTEKQLEYAHIDGTKYYFDHRKEDLYDFYVYQECGTPIDDKTVDSTKRQWAYVKWSLREQQ